MARLRALEAFEFLMLKYAFSHILETIFLSFLTSTSRPKNYKLHEMKNDMPSEVRLENFGVFLKNSKMLKKKYAERTKAKKIKFEAKGGGEEAWAPGPPGSTSDNTLHCFYIFMKNVSLIIWLKEVW